MRTARRVARTHAMIGLAMGVAACRSPGARPLAGAPTTAPVPRAELAPRPALWRYTWSYRDETFSSTGDGALRIAPPDRARLDFFLRNGSGGGYAILVGDELTIPGPDFVKRFLPPPEMLWATLGRLKLPATPDTVARMDRDTLRVDLGALRGADASRSDGRAWRVAFVGGALARVEHIESGRIVEWLTRVRTASGHWSVKYVNERARRALDITVTDTTVVEGFDESIWRRPS